MKPFNLEDALNGAKVVTRFKEHFENIKEYTTSKGTRYVGLVNGSLKVRCSGDLFMAEEETVTYTNVYSNGNIGGGYSGIEGCVNVGASSVDYMPIAVLKTTITPDSEPKAKVEIVHWYGQEDKQDPEIRQIQAKDVKMGDVVKLGELKVSVKDVSVVQDKGYYISITFDRTIILKEDCGQCCEVDTIYHTPTDLLTIVNDKAKKS